MQVQSAWFIPLSLPALGLQDRTIKGWWQSSFPENVLLRVSLLGKYSLANIYSTFDRKLKTKVPTVQTELARGHPELSACVYFWETGHCNDLLLISGKVGTFLLQNLAWKLSFFPCLKKWVIFLSVYLRSGQFLLTLWKTSTAPVSSQTVSPWWMTNHVGSSAVGETSPSHRHLRLWDYKSHICMWTYIRT